LLLIGALIGAGVAGFLLIAAAALLVTIGVHQEERRMTFTRRRGPTAVSRLTRLIVGRYVRAIDPEPIDAMPPGPEPSRPAPADQGQLAVAPPGVGCSH